MRVPGKLIGEFSDMTVLCVVSCTSADTIVNVGLSTHGYLHSVLRRVNDMTVNRTVVRIRHASW